MLFTQQSAAPHWSHITPLKEGEKLKITLSKKDVHHESAAFDGVGSGGSSSSSSSSSSALGAKKVSGGGGGSGFLLKPPPPPGSTVHYQGGVSPIPSGTNLAGTSVAAAADATTAAAAAAATGNDEDWGDFTS
jgi:hypothetical protein